MVCDKIRPSSRRVSPTATWNLQGCSFFAVGAGVMKGGAATGARAGSPLGVPALPVVLKLANVAAEVLYAGEAPGLVGCLQVNARIPANFPEGDRGSVVLSVGAAESRVGVTFWLK